jgi:hypothetical protein
MKKFYLFFIQISLLMLWIFPVNGQENQNRIISIEWENNLLAAEYQIQISDSANFQKILFQKNTKDTFLLIESKPIYTFGRIAAVDQFGYRGDYSEIFTLERLLSERKIIIPNTIYHTNFVNSDHTILLDLQDGKSKLLKTLYKINDGKWQFYNDGIHLKKEGKNAIQYYSEDRLGNKEAAKAKDFILDTEGPEIYVNFTNTIVGLENILYTNKYSAITINAVDWNSGIQSIKAYLRNANGYKEFTWYEKIVIPDNYSEKLIEIKVIATDRTGNTKSYSKFFKHDTTPPSVSIETITNSGINKRQTSISFLNAHDTNSGIKIIHYSINNSEWQPYLDPIIITDPGEYELKFFAIDNVGNKSTTQYERIFISDYSQKK